MPAIEIKNLTKTYPLDFVETAKSMRDAVLGRKGVKLASATKVALDSLTLSVVSGERIGIIGRNGAGKSTLLHLIAGVADASDGELHVDGHVTSILTLGIGLREELTGRENIYLDGEVQGRSRAEVDAVIDEIVDFADLDEFIDRPVRTYSTGMKSRLAFAMISYLDPEILLIDEALSVGDAVFATKATQRIREICTRGKIVFVVSHSMSSIREICNRCIWLENGRVMMDGDPKIVTEAYLQAIREADEKVLLQKFRSHVGAESYEPGFAITLLETRSEDMSQARSVLAADREWVIRIAGALSGGLADYVLKLTIERLDGLHLLDEELSLANLPDAVTAKKTFDAELILPPALAYGIYRVEASLSEGDRLLARRGTIVELTVDETPTGGRPALICPSTITSNPLSVTHAGI